MTTRLVVEISSDLSDRLYVLCNGDNTKRRLFCADAIEGAARVAEQKIDDAARQRGETLGAG